MSVEREGRRLLSVVDGFVEQPRWERPERVSLAALEGAACMNNTFCLAIFMALVYFKGLAWKFSAETLTILVRTPPLQHPPL